MLIILEAVAFVVMETVDLFMWALFSPISLCLCLIVWIGFLLVEQTR